MKIENYKNYFFSILISILIILTAINTISNFINHSLIVSVIIMKERQINQTSNQAITLSRLFISTFLDFLSDFERYTQYIMTTTAITIINTAIMIPAIAPPDNLLFYTQMSFSILS